jgi:DNA-binding NarL/FixJ family response regulator
VFPEINILIIDDEALFRTGLISQLREFNINIKSQAENGWLGLEKIKTTKPDIVLLDLKMPELNGSKTLDNITRRFSQVKVIIISSYHNEQLIKDHFNRGAKAYISKRENIETVATAIRAVYAGIKYIDNIPSLLKIDVKKDKHYFKLFFTIRELEIIARLILNKTLKEMAFELFIPERTIEKYVTLVYKKTNVKNRAAFMKYAISEGLQYLGDPVRRLKT